MAGALPPSLAGALGRTRWPATLAGHWSREMLAKQISKSAEFYYTAVSKMEAIEDVKMIWAEMQRHGFTKGKSWHHCREAVLRILAVEEMEKLREKLDQAAGLDAAIDGDVMRAAMIAGDVTHTDTDTRAMRAMRALPVKHVVMDAVLNRLQSEPENRENLRMFDIQRLLRIMKTAREEAQAPFYSAARKRFQEIQERKKCKSMTVDDETVDDETVDKEEPRHGAAKVLDMAEPPSLHDYRTAGDVSDNHFDNDSKISAGHPSAIEEAKVAKSIRGPLRPQEPPPKYHPPREFGR